MPTPKQIEICSACEWEYLGDGIFAKGETMGWFTDSGFVKE